MLLLDGFLAQCKNQPQHAALVEGEHSLSYSALHIAACRITARLAQLGVKPTVPIAIALDRGIDATTAIFGILYCGCCYIPLDTKNPQSRLRFIVEDAHAQVLIGRGNCPDWVQNKGAWLDLDQLEHPKIECEIYEACPETLSAILYTSGSTGTPKGVALSRRAMSAFATWAGRTFEVRPTDQIASLSPFYFDLSVFDIFTGLNNGATVNFIPIGFSLYPSKLSTWLKETRISVWYTVPSLLCFLAFKGNLSQTSLTDLRTILFAGEVFPTPQLIRLLELLPTVKFFNLFGPTETNVCCYWPVDRCRLQPQKSIPIGLPACEAQLRIDPKQNELLAKGPTLFSGYWIAGKLDNRIHPNAWFGTGDRVSLSQKGEFFYHGRLDRMLKCAGYRIEPVEIESIINLIHGVIQSAVVGIEDSVGGYRPAAVVVISPSCNIGELQSTLRRRLPAYMVPAKISVLPALPCLPNGKVDYAAVKNILRPVPRNG